MGRGDNWLEGPGKTHRSDSDERQHLTASVTEKQLSQRILYARNRVKEDNPDFKGSRVDGEADAFEQRAHKDLRKSENTGKDLATILQMAAEKRMAENDGRKLRAPVRDSKNKILRKLLAASRETSTTTQGTSAADHPPSSESGSSSGEE